MSMDPKKPVDRHDSPPQQSQKTIGPRRNFFRKISAGGLATAGASALLMPLKALAYGGPYMNAFVLSDNTLFMNIGSTGSTPREVLKNLDKNNTALAIDPGLTFNTQEMRSTIAPGFGADPNEIVMSLGATDGMGKIFAGCQFNPGDEIISTNMEHPGGNSAMQITADRRGLIIKRINLPTNDAYSDAAVLARFEALVTNNTKAIMFSSPLFLTGVRLPEKLLCQWAASRGLISIVDGAQGPGMLNLNFHDMGCDFYAGSGHKWQCGPGQTGILYVRNGFTPVAYQKTATLVGGGIATMTLPGYANTNPLPTFFPTVSGIYTGAPGSILAGRTKPESECGGAADVGWQSVLSGAARPAGMLLDVGHLRSTKHRELHRQLGAVLAGAPGRYLGAALPRGALWRRNPKPCPRGTDLVQSILARLRLQRRFDTFAGNSTNGGGERCSSSAACAVWYRRTKHGGTTHAAGKSGSQRSAECNVASAAHLHTPVPSARGCRQTGGCTLTGRAAALMSYPCLPSGYFGGHQRTDGKRVGLKMQ